MRLKFSQLNEGIWLRTDRAGEGCDQGQGYLFAKAVPIAEATRLLGVGRTIKAA
jgi:hypothetical protein